MSHPIHPSNRSGQRGFSVVEIMIALTISLVLLAGVYKIYLGSKQSYRLTEGEARLQENGRFAMYFLTRQIRGAGYIGCANLDSVNSDSGKANIIVTSRPTDLVFNTASVITGYDSGTWPAKFPAKPGNLVSGNSVILVRSASPVGTQLTTKMDRTNTSVQVVGNPESWKAGDYLFVTDCAHADIFEATGVSSGAGPITISYGASYNVPGHLSAIYAVGSQMMAYHSHLFYLGTSSSGAGNSLYEVSDGGTPEELVDNVQAMSALYGVDTDGDKAANLYDSAAQVNAIVPATNGWPKVVSVRVSLVLRSPNDHVVARPQSYTYYAASQTPTTKVAPDHRLYAVFNDTITLRNRTQ
jgi:type IV pilus assembly protein PilW